MKYRLASAAFTVILLSENAWGEIYKTTDEEGNTVFTDTPPTEESEVVNLPEANVADSVELSPVKPTPQPKSGQVSSPGTRTVNKPPESDVEEDDVYLVGDTYGDRVEKKEAREIRKELREGERLEHKAPGPHVAPHPHRR